MSDNLDTKAQGLADELEAYAEKLERYEAKQQEQAELIAQYQQALWEEQGDDEGMVSMDDPEAAMIQLPQKDPAVFLKQYEQARAAKKARLAKEDLMGEGSALGEYTHERIATLQRELQRLATEPSYRADVVQRRVEIGRELEKLARGLR